MKKLNILTLGDFEFNKNIYSMPYENINCIYTIASCKLTSKIKQDFANEARKNNRKIKLFPHKKLKTLNFYTNSVDWSNIEPLSNKLVESSALCQIETLKMYERISKLSPPYYENRKKHFYYSLQYFNNLLDKCNIDVFIRYSVPHMGYDNVIYHLCKLKGIKTYMVYFIHPYWGYIMEDYKDPLKKFKYVKDRGFKIKKLEEMFNEYWDKKELSYKPVQVPPSKRGLFVQQRRERRFSKIISYYQSQVTRHPNLNIPFIFVALHFQYEATTNPLAGIFVDQLLMLDILSRTGINIYVKEHPRISANRSIEYYKKILAMKNTYLIDTNYSSYTLTDKCYAVANCTGTAGWEAVMKGKPCLLFGNIHYQYAPYVFKIDSLNDCMIAIEKIKTLKISKNKIIEYLKGLEEYLINLNHKDIGIKFNKILEELEIERKEEKQN